MYSIDQPITLGRPLRRPGLQQTAGEHHRRRYDRRLEDARPWLYGIASNLLRHHFRSSKRKDRADRRALALAELETTAQPLEQLEAQMLGPRLTQALQAMPVADREALLLFAWAELSYQEIALALDIPLGTVRSRIHRARAGVLAARTPAIKTHHVIANASAQRLTHLSVKLADDPVPTGNATLVLRRQTYPNSPEIDGADPYADNGNYYYSPTLACLPAVIQQNETVTIGSADSEQRDIAAANAALSEPIDQARQQMSVANFDPNVKPNSVSPTAAQNALKNAPAQIRQKLEQIQTRNQQDNLHSVISQEDGMIWDNGMDALRAGAGNPQVRAGVLKLFATIPQISTSTGTLNGQQTLDVTASLLSSNSGLYQEQLVLNASTGVPLEMIGGNQGQTPSVTVYYTVTRTTLDAVENGSAG